jgi:hypothetical protein
MVSGSVQAEAKVLGLNIPQKQLSEIYTCKNLETGQMMQAYRPNEQPAVHPFLISSDVPQTKTQGSPDGKASVLK